MYLCCIHFCRPALLSYYLVGLFPPSSLPSSSLPPHYHYRPLSSPIVPSPNIDSIPSARPRTAAVSIFSLPWTPTDWPSRRQWYILYVRWRHLHDSWRNESYRGGWVVSCVCYISCLILIPYHSHSSSSLRPMKWWSLGQSTRCMCHGKHCWRSFSKRWLFGRCHSCRRGM